MSSDPLSDVLSGDGVRSVYQPIVDLFTGDTVGYEALARGPEGPLERPAELFGAAERAGRLMELDTACRRAAVRGALRAGLHAPSSLFVNLEPQVQEARGFEDPVGLAGGPADMRIVFEITERALTTRPADLIPAVGRLRAQGWGIALDDVGVDRRSLALMPLLRPDVIKLDLRLIQGQASDEVAEIHNAVSAQAERTGATVLAEGIETPEHEERARAMGATLAQGFMLGRPGPLPTAFPPVEAPVPISPLGIQPAPPSPYESMRRVRPVRRGTKRLLFAISRELERQVDRLGPNAVVISTFQERRHFTPATAELYAHLARRAAFVGALGRDMDTTPAPGVRGAKLGDNDPLLEEWDIAVVGPHYAACFAARDLGDDVPDFERRFDFALSHDRELALGAARSLMSRIVPVPAASLAEPVTA